PSMAAWGASCGLRGADEAAGLEPGIHGKRVVVQGIGKVGFALVRLLIDAGAEAAVSDVDAARLEAAKALGARVVANESVHLERCDVLSPCATGALLNERTIPELGRRIVAGGANNPLETLGADDPPARRGQLSAP